MAGLDFDLGNVLRFEPGYDMLNRWVFNLYLGQELGFREEV